MASIKRRDSWSPVVAVTNHQHRFRPLDYITSFHQEEDTGNRMDKHENGGILGSSGYQELHNMPQSSDEVFDFTAKEFRVLRTLLRLMSLWRPREAGVFERYVYPVFVNLILLFPGLVRNTIQSVVEASWLSIESMYIVHEIGTWFGHILGNYYFRSGDLSKVLPRKPLPGVMKPLKRKLKFLNGFVLVSFVVFTITLVTTFVVWHLEWNSGPERFTANLPHVHGTLDHVLYALVPIGIVYDLGIGLALSWTMGLLYICYACRLKSLETIFLKWRASTNDAIYYFQLVYARPMKHSWKRISWWFLANNVIAVAIPLYGYKLAHELCSSAHQSKHLPQFACYLMFVLAMWLTPIIMAEQVKRREKAFSEHVNNFCFGLLRQQSEDFRAMTSLPVNDQLAGSVDSGHVGCNEDTPPYPGYIGSRENTAVNGRFESHEDTTAYAGSHGIDTPSDTGHLGSRGDTPSDTGHPGSHEDKAVLVDRVRSNEDTPSSTGHLRSHGDAHTPPDTDHLGFHGDTSVHAGFHVDTAVDSGYTFASRGKKLREFLRFLKGRKQGLVARGYSLQLHLSVISIFVGVVSFLLKLNNEPQHGSFPITTINNTLH